MAKQGSEKVLPLRVEQQRKPKSIRACINAGVAYEVPPLKRGYRRWVTQLSDLPEGWQDKIIKMAREGKGVTAWQAELGVSTTAINTLLNNHQEVRDVWEQATLLSKAWWEDQGRRMVKGGLGNGGVYAFSMANRFGWSSTTKIVGDANQPVGIQEIRRTIIDPKPDKV